MKSTSLIRTKNRGNAAYDESFNGCDKQPQIQEDSTGHRNLAEGSDPFQQSDGR
ncbi:hypothetical protein LBSG162_05960 [Lentilactobacillus buchneri subsp. silagei]|nr:hypothetical protein Ltb232_10570 [Lentilactobacillus buchneri subsp. silagei]GED91491.1 hypothetical protein LBSG162_05960 [Lentilactobacillus buchneri subsp. silagei]GED93865.1 hypothetical protein LBSP_04250 [Lentilactobacillus buchneri subsp. silagei]